MDEFSIHFVFAATVAPRGAKVITGTVCPLRLLHNDRKAVEEKDW